MRDLINLIESLQNNPLTNKKSMTLSEYINKQDNLSEEKKMKLVKMFENETPVKYKKGDKVSVYDTSKNPIFSGYRFYNVDGVIGDIVDIGNRKIFDGATGKPHRGTHPNSLRLVPFLQSHEEENNERIRLANMEIEKRRAEMKRKKREEEDDDDGDLLCPSCSEWTNELHNGVCIDCHDNPENSEEYLSQFSRK